jgi:hypothetical protein
MTALPDAGLAAKDGWLTHTDGGMTYEHADIDGKEPGRS